MDAEYPLKTFGLSDKEISTYIELLPLGQVSLHEIAKRLSFPRSTVYHTLHYLQQKGLVASIIKDKKTYYNATEPTKLVDQLKEKEQLIQDILPELQALKSQSISPSAVEIYEGFKGVHTILADLCSKQQQVYYFGGYRKSLEVLKHLPNYVRRQRIEKHIPAKMIYDKTDEKILHTKEYQEVSELRFHKAMEDFPCMIFIYGDKTSMFSHKTDLVGVIIKNKDFAEAMKMIFYMYWEQATQFKTASN